MYGTGLIKGMGITIRHIFENKKLVVQYPEVRPFLQERFRGDLVFDFENCIACGLCEKTCPNQVLSLETAKDENTGKKKLMRYTINLQYCMFCNLCIEACPKDCLRFDHNFELARFERDEIKQIYDRPADLDERLAAKAAAEAAKKAAAGGDEPADDEAAAKKAKQIAAMDAGLVKNGTKMLSKLLGDEDEAARGAAILAGNEKKRATVAKLMVEDKERAASVVRKFIASAEKGGDA